MLRHSPYRMVGVLTALLAAAALLCGIGVVLLLAPRGAAVVPIVPVQAPPTPDQPGPTPDVPRPPATAPDNVQLSQRDRHGDAIPWGASAPDDEITLQTSIPPAMNAGDVTFRITRQDGRVFSKEAPVTGETATVTARPLPPGKYTWRVDFPGQQGSAERSRPSLDDVDFQVPQPDLRCLEIDQFTATGGRLALGEKTEQAVVIAALLNRDEATLFVEVKRVTEAFDGTDICSAAATQHQNVIRLSLPPGAYQWRWRVQPSEGPGTSWKEFGDNGAAPDFEILAPPRKASDSTKPPPSTGSGFSGVSSGTGEGRPAPSNPRTAPRLWELLTSVPRFLVGTTIVLAAVVGIVITRVRRARRGSSHV